MPALRLEVFDTTQAADGTPAGIAEIVSPPDDARIAFAAPIAARCPNRRLSGTERWIASVYVSVQVPSALPVALRDMLSEVCGSTIQAFCPLACVWSKHASRTIWLPGCGVKY